MNVLAVPAKGTPARDNPCAAQHFNYDPPTHTATCPRGQQLDHEGGTTQKGMGPNASAVTAATARYVATARAIPKAGRWTCGRTLRSYWPCAGA